MLGLVWGLVLTGFLGVHGYLSVSTIYGLLAATALTNGLTLVTRNDRDVAGLGATVFNPFRGAENRHRP